MHMCPWVHVEVRGQLPSLGSLIPQCCAVSVWFFETEFLCVVLAELELTV